MAKKIKADALASEVMKELDDYSSLTTEVMKKAVRNAGKTVREEIADTAPKKTGTYGKSWAVKKTGEDSKSLQVTVHSKNRYQIAHLLEHGHAKRGGGRVAARPHIAPAEENGIRQLEEEYGIKIFYKDRKELKPTPEGAVLVKYARRALAIHNS